MRSIARVFIALFCITFLANQAMSTDTGLDRLATLVQKLMMYSANGFNTHAQGLALLEKRISVIENKLHVETGYDKTTVSTADELALKRMISKAEKANVEYQASSKELFDYVKRLSR